MIAITVKTPFDKDLELVWKDRKVTVKGDKEAKVYWRSLEDKGLWGLYGHTLNLENCFFQDLAAAISVALRGKNYSVSSEGKKQIDKEIAHSKKNPIPKGAKT